MDKNVIEVKNICKTYKLYKTPIDRLKEALSISKKVYHKDYFALSNISFNIKKGETVAIIGLNGAGKSTLLKIITGVLTPTSGEVIVDGNISALLELGAGFNPEYTGIENIYLSGNMRGYSREQMDDKIESICEFADIGDFIYQPVKTYSSGMFARLAFAVSINVEPNILIVDEALSVGDIFFQQKCNQYMKERMSNVTKIIVTHDMGTVSNMADRVILLENGEVIFDGSVKKGVEKFLKKLHNSRFKTSKSSNTSTKKELNEIYDGSYKIINSKNIGGANEVVITHVKYSINDNNLEEVVSPGDLLKVDFIIKSSKDIDNLIVGYSFKDKYGKVIFAQNTLGQDILVEHQIYDDNVYNIVIEILWPHIVDDDYFLTLGIGEGYDQMVHTIQCWAHNIIHLKSVSKVPMHGIINHNMNNIYIEILK